MQVAGGWYRHHLTLRSDGTVWAWGDDTSGQLGNAPSDSPVTRLAWGNNQLSQLGIGSQASVTGPVQVVGLTSATQVAAGLDVSFAIHTVPYLVGL